MPSPRDADSTIARGYVAFHLELFVDIPKYSVNCTCYFQLGLVRLCRYMSHSYRRHQPDPKKSRLASSRTAYRQFPHLLQHSFDLSIQLSGGVIIPDRLVEVPLHIGEFLVPLFSELALHADHGFERRVEVGHTQAEKLRKFGNELVVEKVKDFFGFVVFLLRPWKPRRVVTRLGERLV